MDLLVIPDGNRRWAEEKGKDFDYGYSTLPITINRIIDTLSEEGINRFYLWCNSISNLKRPSEQIESCLKHYSEILDYATNPAKIRILIKGNRKIKPTEFLSQPSKFKKEIRSLADKVYGLEKQTKDNRGFDLYYFFNYSTEDDLQRAIKKTKKKDIATILSNMDEPDNIDVILRTGGYHRLSGFTPIKSPNTEIVFFPECFPDLSADRIKKVIDIYRNRVINDGK